MSTAAPAARAVAIIGMGCRFPDAGHPAALWHNLLAGKQSFTEIPADRWRHERFFSTTARELDKTYVHRGAFLDQVDQFPALTFGIAPRRLAVMDPQHRLVLDAVRTALQDAGLEKAAFARRTTGTFIGISSSEYRSLLGARTLAAQMLDGALGEAPAAAARAALAAAVGRVEPINAFSIPGALLNLAATNVANHWRLGGPAYAIDAACASAMVAIYEAALYLRAGLCDLALAGGVYLNLTPDNLIGFARASAISRRGDCRPFDADADGFVQGEGVGVVVLKRLDQALADGDRVYAVIRGLGINNDGAGEGPMAPSPDGQLECLRRAYADAACPPESVELVECHGTGTPVGDPVEVEALRRLYADGAPSAVHLSSIKGNIGHTMSAAGIAGLMRAALALQRETIPPQAGFARPHPNLALDRTPFVVPTEAKPWPRRATPRRAGVSSFGFGATNCHLVLEEAPAPAAEPATIGAELVLLSAGTPAQLAAHARDVAAVVERDRLPLAAVAYTLSVTRALEPYRLAVAARDREALVAELLAAADAIAAAPTGVKLSPSAFATVTPGGRAPRLAFMFPGQGAQRVGLLSNFYERFPVFRARVDALAAALDGILPAPMLSYLYPAGGNGGLEEAERRLQATEICQPVLAALGIALADLLATFGLTPSLCLGHSLGEFAAAAVADYLSGEEAVRFVARRGKLMAELVQGDCGAMAAVRADAETVRPHLQPGAVIANLNQPQQTVISGSTAAVEASIAALKAARISARRLRVSHAFHSPVVEPVRAPVNRLVDAMALRPGRCPVLSTSTVELYPTDDAGLARVREIFRGHATAPVDFLGAMRAPAADEIDLFLQVGAGSTLVSFVPNSPATPRLAATVAKDEEDDFGELARALGLVAVLGGAPDLRPLFPPERRALVTLPPTPLATERYWGIRSGKAAPLAVGDDAAPGAGSAELVALFREQTELIRQQTELLAWQRAVLTGEASVDATPAEIAALRRGAAPLDASTPADPAAPAAPPPAATEQTIRQVVVDTIARISAFPASAIKPEQSLANDLGLDSLMFVELASTLQKSFPSLAGMPQSLTGKSTTVADLITYLEGELSDAARAAPPAPHASAGEAPLGAYAPALVPRARVDGARDTLVGCRVLVTTDRMTSSEPLAAALAARGAEVVVVRLGARFAGVERDERGAARLSWPDAPETIGDLFAELGRQGLSPVSVIHAAAVTQTRPLVEVLADPAYGWPNPVPLAAALAAGLAAATDGAPRAFVVVTGMGGGFGLDGGAEDTVWQAGLAGFSKALAREWPAATVKVVDLDLALPAHELAAHLVGELCAADRDVEVGIHATGRQLVALAPLPQQAAATPFPPGPVVITGGAGELGLRIAAAEAARGARLILIDAKPESAVAADLDRLRASGAECAYVAWDLLAQPPPATLEAAFTRLGAPGSVIHAAGLSRDRRVEEKPAGDYALVMGVKITGLLRLWAALPVGAAPTLVTFSSWAGRFGNVGQTDYAAANELLARLTTVLARQHPGTKISAIAWPPWDETAMVRSIPEPVKAAMRGEGVLFLSPAEGLAALAAERARPESGEVVIGRALPAERRVVERQIPLSRATHPFLDDHQVGGTPLLPLAAAIELMLDTARAGGLDGPLALEGLKVFQGIRVAAPTTVTVRLAWQTEAPARRLRGTVELAHEGRTAYRATLAEAGPTPAAPALEGGSTHLPLALDRFYGEVLFHGPRLRGVTRIDEIGAAHIAGWVTPSRPAEWQEAPPTARWTLDPKVVDAGFQLALYWMWTRHQRLALPVGLGRLQLFGAGGERPVRVVASLRAAGPDDFTGHVRYEDEGGALVALLEDVQTKVVDLGPRAAAAVIDERHYRIDRFEEVEGLHQRLQMAELMGLGNPYFHAHDGVARNTALIGGRELINYSSYNYLGLSGHPAVSAAAKAAVDRYGTSVSASRIASGEIPLHRELEQTIAELLGTEDAIVFSAGHMTNETTIGHLLGEGDLIIHDALAHNSIQEGAKLSGAKRRPFPHNDWQALDHLLATMRGQFRRVLVALEGVYSMDGDIPDLPRFIEVARRHRCLLLVDEAHSLGVLGDTGRGVGELFAVERGAVDLWMGTLSKALASCGGYIAGSRALVDYLKYTAPAFVFSAGISPANAAAARAAIAELRAHPELVGRLRHNAQLFLRLAKARGIDTGLSHGSAVIPCIVGNSLSCIHLAARLGERGVNVQPIVYPAVDESSARLRFFVSATHESSEIERTVAILADELARLRDDAPQPQPAT